MVVKVQHWNAFTRQPGKGNPAGIVLGAQTLSESDMQAIAKVIGFTNTNAPLIVMTVGVAFGLEALDYPQVRSCQASLILSLSKDEAFFGFQEPFDKLRVSRKDLNSGCSAIHSTCG